MVHCVLAGRSSVFSTVSCILSRLLSDSGIIVGCQFFECVMLRLLGVFLFSASLVHRFPSLSSASQAATLPHPGCRGQCRPFTRCAALHPTGPLHGEFLGPLRVVCHPLSKFAAYRSAYGFWICLQSHAACVLFNYYCEFAMLPQWQLHASFLDLNILKSLPLRNAPDSASSSVHVWLSSPVMPPLCCIRVDCHFALSRIYFLFRFLEKSAFPCWML